MGWFQKMGLFFVLLSLLFWEGCSKSPPSSRAEGENCQVDMDCQGILLCVRGACRKKDCPEVSCPLGFGCIGNLCCSDEYCCGIEGPVGDSTCSNSYDDDCDGWIDEEDPDCIACLDDDACQDNHPCTLDWCDKDKGVCRHEAQPHCCQGNGNFEQGLSINLDAPPDSSKASDFDGNGVLDLAIAVPSLHRVYVFAGKTEANIASGRFEAAFEVEAGNDPAALLVQDLDQDGKPDILVANPSLDAISVLFNQTNQQGFRFGPRLEIPVLQHPVAVAAADLDSDGVMDLVVANQGSGKISLVFGAQETSWMPKSTLELLVGEEPVSVAVGNLNGDTHLDLVVANQVSSTVSLFFGQGIEEGDMLFGEAQELAVEGLPSSLLLADFDRMGGTELAVLCPEDKTIKIFGGDFSIAASLRASVFLGESTQATAFFSGDFNGDNLPDLVVAKNIADTAVLFLNQTDLSGQDTDLAFEKGTEVLACRDPAHVVTADLNQDGSLDLLVSCQAGKSLDLLFGQGACCLTTTEPHVELSCADGLDNDCDGYTDCEDPDCVEAEACQAGDP